MDDFKQFVMDQWGADLKGKKFLMTGEYKYWLVSEEVAKKKIIGEVAGYYFARRNKDGTYRLSIEGSQIVGPLSTKNVVEINDKELWNWLRGIDIENNHDQMGWVILKHKDDFVGCGKAFTNGILNHVPKERRIKNLI